MISEKKRSFSNILMVCIQFLFVFRRGFCDDFDRCCGSGLLFQISRQIDPFESLTLCISDDCTSIYATGKRMTWGGNTYTNYSIPSLL